MLCLSFLEICYEKSFIKRAILLEESNSQLAISTCHKYFHGTNLSVTYLLTEIIKN